MFLAGILLVASAVPFPLANGGCSTATFAESAVLTTGDDDSPSSVAVGDFDLDGKLDLAFTNPGSGGVRIRLGDGTGGFPANEQSGFALDRLISRVVAGDLNLDGKPDLVVLNRGAPNSPIPRVVTIHLGNGSGTFPQTPSFTWSVPEGPRSLAIGDLDLDGKPDLVVADGVNVLIRRGDGTGAFPDANASTLNAGTVPDSVAIEDLDLDGKADLVVTCDAPPPGNVTLFLGDGLGGFSAATPLSVAANPRAVAIGDLDHDGKPDLVIFSSQSSDAAIRLGDGTGGFPDADASTVSVGPQVRDVFMGDLNLDGNPDLAFSDGGFNVKTRLGDGMGGFPPAGNWFFPATRVVDIAGGDFDLDGKLDLAVAGSEDDYVAVHRNTCDALPCEGANFAQPPGSPWGALTNPSSVAVGDFDRDGKLDLVVANESSDSLRIRKGDGTGGFPDLMSGLVDIGEGSMQVAVGDLNLDGKDDLTIVHADIGPVFGGTIRLGDGTGSFPPTGGSTFDESLRISSLTIGDMNRDGTPDLVFVSRLSGIVKIRRGDGTGGFPDDDSSTFNLFQPRALAIGDLNLDGKPDLVISSGQTVALRLGDGSGGFPDSSSSTVAGIHPISLAIGDLNRDGKPDLAVTTSCCPASVMILLGDGDGGFPEAGRSTIVTGITYDFVAARDLDLDGNLDLALVERNAGTVTIRRGDGNGGFPDSSVSTVGAGTGPITIAFGDWNQDGRPDLAAANRGSDDLTIQLNTCSNDAPAADAGDDQTVACAGATTQVTLDGSGSSDPDWDALAYSWSEGGNEIATGVSPTVSLATGSHAITLTVTDPDEATSTDVVTVVVADTTPPVITLTTGDIILRRPHHRYVEYDVTAFMSGASDGCDSAIDGSDVVIASVSSDEPENANGNGDGNTVNDIVIAPGCRSVKLRHERAESLNGRVYSVTLAVKDAAGNLGMAVRRVQVPVGPGTATDDGAAAGYTVGGCAP